MPVHKLPNGKPVAVGPSSRKDGAGPLVVMKANSQKGFGKKATVRHNPKVNHKAFDKHTIYTNNSKTILPSNISNNMSFKPAPNAMKIYNEFKQDQHDTFYYTHNKQNAAYNLPIMNLEKNEDNKLAYTVPALAAIAFLSTVMDDAPIADLIPDNVSASTL